jgi:hypothetical protein
VVFYERNVRDTEVDDPTNVARVHTGGIMRKFRNSHSSIVALTCIVLLGACGDEVVGSGNVTSEDRPVSGVTAVSLETLGDLAIEVGNQDALRVEAEDNLIDYLKTTVNDGVLEIKKVPGTNISPTRPVRYYLTVTALQSIRTTSSGNASALGLNASHFSVQVGSSGNVDLAALSADSFEATVSSIGKLRIGGGQVVSQSVKLTSSGVYTAGDLRSASATIDISASGSATIWVADHLTANLTSSGSLNYYGSPSVSVNRSSSGDAVSLGDR